MIDEAQKKWGRTQSAPCRSAARLGAERTYSLNFAASAWTSASVLQYSPRPK